MTDTTYLFHNYQLNNLQKENSSLNYSEFLRGESVLKSYPRRLLIQLFSPVINNLQSQYFNPIFMNNYRSSLSFAEELILISSATQGIHTNLQTTLHFADDFNINKSLSIKLSALKGVSPWIFQYNVSKVNVNIGDNLDYFTSSLDYSAPLRELVVRKYFAVVKPYITITADICKINLDGLEKLIAIVSDIGADRLVLYNSRYLETSSSINNIKTEAEHIAIFSKIRKHSEMYGLEISLPGYQKINESSVINKDTKNKSASDIVVSDSTVSKNDMNSYHLWSDLFITPQGISQSLTNVKNEVLSMPASGSDFIPDIWNSDKLIDSRVKNKIPGNKAINKFAMCNRDFYIFRDSIML